MNRLELPKAFVGEGFSGVGFKVFFEICSLFWTAKGYSRFNSPRAAF
jgi:hypothetical protein